METIESIKSAHLKKSLALIKAEKANVIFDIVFGVPAAQVLLVAHELNFGH
ncbi:hypothetical protein ACFORL_03055 [Legionella dresdenensis]|uniref:Uncharacterized protein n=1 Tax=Legionella dresdenensis TaxID=450200 RepID=A0ABV8CCM2_9GAMM